MNPDLQKQLAEMLAKLTDATTGAATWAQTQVGPLVQEKIVFGRAWETFFLLTLIAICVAGVKWSRALWALHLKEAYADWEIGAVIVGILSAICGVCCLAQLHDVLLVWFAPRLYIVEWLKSMVTKA